MALPKLKNIQRVLMDFAGQRALKIIHAPDKSMNTSDLVLISNFADSINKCEDHQVSLMSDIIEAELSADLQFALIDHINEVVESKVLKRIKMDIDNGEPERIKALLRKWCPLDALCDYMPEQDL